MDQGKSSELEASCTPRISVGLKFQESINYPEVCYEKKTQYRDIESKEEIGMESCQTWPYQNMATWRGRGKVTVEISKQLTEAESNCNHFREK